jgi:hypothetical protein
LSRLPPPSPSASTPTSASTSHRRPPIRWLSRPTRWCRRRFGRLLPVVAVPRPAAAPTSVGCHGRLAGADSALADSPSPTARQCRMCHPRDASVRHCRLHSCAVSIADPSSPSSRGTSPTTTPRVTICVPSSRTWRVQRHRWSDQPIWRKSPPSTSPSMRLPPFEHRAAATSPLRAVASPPLVPAAGYQRAFSGMYVAGGSHAAAPTRALQPRRPIGPLHCCTRSSPSPREDVAGFHHATSLGAGCHRPRMVFVAPLGSSSPTSSTAAASPQVTCLALLAIVGPADCPSACLGI